MRTACGSKEMKVYKKIGGSYCNKDYNICGLCSCHHSYIPSDKSFSVFFGVEQNMEATFEGVKLWALV